MSRSARDFGDPWRYICPDCRRRDFYYRPTIGDYRCRMRDCLAVFPKPLDLKSEYKTNNQGQTYA